MFFLLPRQCAKKKINRPKSSHTVESDGDTTDISKDKSKAIKMNGHNQQNKANIKE